MSFSTREQQEAFIYPVDIKTKTVGEQFELPNNMEGFFTNIFGVAA